MDISGTLQTILVAVASLLSALCARYARGAVRPTTQISLDGNGNTVKFQEFAQLVWQLKLDMHEQNAKQNERLVKLEGSERRIERLEASDQRIARLEACFEYLMRAQPWASTGKGPEPKPAGTSD